MVRQNVQNRIPVEARLDKVERDEPFFRFYYVFGPSKYQVEFTFDPLAKRIDVRGIQSQTVTEQVKVVREPIKVIEQPVKVV